MFKKAERKRVKLKISITGPSGSGKTYSSLVLASALGKKIAVIDTENGSASLYSDKFNFDVAVMTPPYTVAKYTAAIRAAVDAGYEVLVIDSLTHAWAGDGGLLAKKESLDSSGKGNSFTNWAGITKEHEALKGALLNSNIHLIATMRSKQEYILQASDKGTQVPKKVGMAPIQREGMEYEFTTVFDCMMNHEVEVSKDRTGLFSGNVFKITEDTGKAFLSWLDGANAEEEPTAFQSPSETRKVTEPQVKRLFAILNSSGFTQDDLKIELAEYGIESTKDLNVEQYNEIVTKLQMAIAK